jgi:hypothetical protein
VGCSFVCSVAFVSYLVSWSVGGCVCRPVGQWVGGPMGRSVGPWLGGSVVGGPIGWLFGWMV